MISISDMHGLYSNKKTVALPFGLGCAIAWGLYNEFRDEAELLPISFGTYSLFIGIAMAITVRVRSRMHPADG